MLTQLGDLSKQRVADKPSTMTITSSANSLFIPPQSEQLQRTSQQAGKLLVTLVALLSQQAWGTSVDGDSGKANANSPQPNGSRLF